MENEQQKPVVVTLPTAEQMTRLRYQDGVNLNFALDGYAMACGYNCEGSVLGWAEDAERGTMPYGEVFLKEAQDQANIRTFFDDSKTQAVLSNNEKTNQSLRWGFSGAGIMPRLENPAALQMATKKIGKEEFVTVNGNVMTWPRRKVTTDVLVSEMNAMLANGEMQLVDDATMCNKSQSDIPVSVNKRYLNPKNGREYVYVDSAQDIRARGWYLCEAVHGTMTQDNAVQVTEIMEQSYFDTFDNFTTRENATQTGAELDVNRSHLGEMLNAYMLPAMVRSAERSQELTARMEREAAQTQTVAQELAAMVNPNPQIAQDAGLSR